MTRACPLLGLVSKQSTTPCRAAKLSLPQLLDTPLPNHIVPPAVAIIGAALALLVVYGARIEPVGEVLRDVDWKTIVFLAAIFTLVQAFIKTELLQGLSIQLYHWFGADLLPVAFLSLAGIGVLSSLLANIPVVAAALVMMTGYLVAAQAVPEIALAPGFTDWPNATLPVFVAMMFGGTLGGNATLIGASANVVAVGICVATRQAGDLHAVPAHWPADRGGAVVGRGPLCWVLASMLG